MSLKVLTKIGTRWCVNRSIVLAHVDTVIFRLSTLLSLKHCERCCLCQIALFQTASVCPPGVLFLYLFSILRHSFCCLSLEDLQNSISQLLPHHSVVEVLFCDGCCPPIIASLMFLILLVQSVPQGDVRLWCCWFSCVSPPYNGLTGEDPQQQLLHAESVPSLLLNLLSLPDAHKCLRRLRSRVSS